MFFLPNSDPRLADALILSATDLVAGSICEFAAVRNPDVPMRRTPAPAQGVEPMGNLPSSRRAKPEAGKLGTHRAGCAPAAGACTPQAPGDGAGAGLRAPTSRAYHGWCWFLAQKIQQFEALDLAGRPARK